MPLALVRIDDRLIHGQVVEAWIPALAIRRVLVISDQAAADPTEAALMRMAMPEGIAIDILGRGDAAAAVREAAGAPERVMVLAPGPAEILSILEAGVRLEAVNVGGLHYAAGRIRLGRAIFLGQEDIAALENIARHGARLEGRAVPADPAEDVLSLIRMKG